MLRPAARARRLPAFAVPILVVVALFAGAFVGDHAWGATPPPTPVPPRGSLSPFPTVLHTQTPSPRRPPKVGAQAVLLEDLNSGQVLFARRPDARRAVASLTKLMTALLVLEDSRPGASVTVSANAAPPRDQEGISNLPLREGETISVEDLLYALLLQSANDAAVALAEHEAGSVDGFVRAMNRRATELGAEDTRFASPNGLDDSGYSTAADLAAIMRADLQEPLFRRIARTKFHTIPAPGGDSRRIQNRNVLLWLYPGTVAGKTGFTGRAGYCLVAVARRDGRGMIAVLLGERGEPFSDAAELFDWGSVSFVPVSVGAAGEPLGERRVGGNSYPVEMASSIDALALRYEARRVRLQVRVDPDVPGHPNAGSTVGTVTAVAPSGVLGSTSLVIGVARASVSWTQAFALVAAEYRRTLERVSG